MIYEKFKEAGANRIFVLTGKPVHRDPARHILLLDTGNTRVKAVIADDKGYRREIMAADRPGTGALKKLLSRYPASKAIVCSTGKAQPDLETLLRKNFRPLIRLSHRTPLPFRIKHNTPQTLGADRLALAAGALRYGPGFHMLIVSFGTCITYNILRKDKTFLGGAITPGLDMRLQAMHRFTSRLPRVELPKEKRIRPESFTFNDRSTKDSILSGAVEGIRGELNHFLALYRKRYLRLKVRFTGGDGLFFQESVSADIRFSPFILMDGLYEIFKHNVKLRS